MKRNRIWSFAVAFFLAAGSVCVPVHAEAGALQDASVILTDENRYDPEYYQEPEEVYPSVRARAFRGAKAGQTLEEYLVEALNNFEEEIDVSAFQIPSDKETAAASFFQVLNSHPELFYVANGVGWSYNASGYVAKYKVSYLGTQEEIISQREELEEAAERVVSEVDRSLDSYQQALIVHDYLVQNCEYDYERFLKNNVPEISHTAYGSLVNKIAVCDGYADAFAYIMEGKLGIPCELVSSAAMAHAWNMIEVDGKWYHVDATWDDPTWDCIGRVGHAYFLLSDGKISNNSPNKKSGNNHYSWSAGHTADSTDYDSAFWADVRSAICHYGDAWYYSRYQMDGDVTRAVQLVKKEEDSLLAGGEAVVYSAPAWPAGESSIYQASYMYLAKVDDRVYFSTPTDIYRVDAAGNVKKFHSPQDLSGMSIYGFTFRDEEFWYAPENSPNTNKKQTDIRKFSSPKITGITAEDVEGVYTGSPYAIQVQGTQPGDVVQYAGADGQFQLSQPNMVDAGTYEVSYQVERDGYALFYGKAEVAIGKAEPDYEIPTNLKGYVGDTLATVGLPEGFSWQEDADTKLETTGKMKFLAEFEPKDVSNYETVTDIELEVEVECPGHQYVSEVTTPPTEEQDGIETYTCKLCGHTYTKKIDKEMQPIIGISAADVEGTYSGQPYVITVTGTQQNDIVQYALQGEAYDSEQPEMKNAGTYQVMYKVERSGCRPFYGSAKVEIAKAVPEFSLPLGCNGKSGETLDSVALPEGFSWQDADIVLREEGMFAYLATYTPDDTDNYQTASAEVTVQVTCPGHNYTFEVTKEPTETEKGEAIYTCILCGHSYTDEIDEMPQELTGISAENVSGPYTGKPYAIEVKGVREGDVVQYALKSGEEAVYDTMQPEMKNAGTYEILYKVSRAGYQPFMGSARVEIARAVPAVDIPMDLEGTSGQTLASVELPAGFLWLTDPDTKLSKTGHQKFYVCYRPQDQVNYQMVMDIEIVVDVTCPGHQYESVVAKAPTETQKGLRTNTCTLCGKVYTEEISMVAPARPDKASGLKMTKRTTKSLEFSWKRMPDVSYRLMLYEDGRVVSTKYVARNTNTYAKLKPATIYTLRVTPYRIVNNQKVYAKTTVAAKTATTPEKAKLSMAKRNGRSRVRLEWKKVAGASGYEISMKTGKGNYKKIKTVGNGKTLSYTKTGLSKSKTYSFRIRAYTSVDEKKVFGDYSNVKKVK